MGTGNTSVRSVLTVLVITALPCALVPLAARAALGEPESTVQADGRALKGELHTSDQVSYRLSQIRAPSGVLVREYASPSGTVFAVTWRGPAMPNLKQLLGAHYAEYAAAAQAAPRVDRHHLGVRTNDLVVEMSGHMRAFIGRAYLKSQVPTGVSVQELP